MASVDDVPSSVRAADCEELAVACTEAAGSGSRSVAGFEASVAGKPWSALEEAGAIGVPFVGDGLLHLGRHQQTAMDWAPQRGW